MQTKLILLTLAAFGSIGLLAVCSCKPGEFVRITDRNGKVYMFRPHMVSQIIGETNGCHIDVAGIGAIPMACTIDEAAKLVKDR